MRELIIRVTDDLCGEQFTEHEAREVQLSWDGKDYALDLCESCRTEIAPTWSITELIEKARKVKVKSEAKASGQPSPKTAIDPFFDRFMTDAGYTCPFVETLDPDGTEWFCQFTTVNAGGLSTHFGRKHGMPIREYVAQQKVRV